MKKVWVQRKWDCLTTEWLEACQAFNHDVLSPVEAKADSFVVYVFDQVWLLDKFDVVSSFNKITMKDLKERFG